MKATTVWNGKMSFTATSASGHSIHIDSDPAVGGENNGARPMELIAIGLAGCTAMDVISILRKKQQGVTQFEVKVDAPRSPEHPKVFTHAVITYIIKGRNLSENALLRAIELSATKYCPAQFMLAQAFPIDMCYEIYEDEGDGNFKLTYQGEWQELPTE